MGESRTAEARGFVPHVRGLERDPDHLRTVIEPWLAAHRPEIADLTLGEISAPSGAGVANETVMFDAQWTEQGETRTGGYVVRIATEDSLYYDADIELHYKAYAALADVPGVPVPTVYGFEHDPSALGARFFVMERIDGLIPADRPFYTEEGFVADATEEQRARLWRSAVQVMAAFHQADPTKFAFLQRPELGKTGLEQDLAYWLRYNERALAGRQHPTLVPAAQWLVDNLPDDRPTSQAWGDARVCNMIFQDFTCVGMLDWDGLSLAGPESDLAWWIVMEDIGGNRVELPGLGSFDELIEYWQQLTGQQVRNLRYHVAYALFRLGAIVIRLNDQMLAAGHLPPGTDISSNAHTIQQLAQLLDLPTPGPITCPVPKVSSIT